MELLKLLLVDDEKIILKGLEETYDWGAMGYQVVGAAESGEAALALLEDEEPDVVITDVRMKKISGLELIEKTKLTHPGIKFVVLSAYKDFAYAKKACEQGALSYLVKPVEDAELAQVMEKAHRMCMEERKKTREYESFCRILADAPEDFLGQMLERYVRDVITENELLVLFEQLFGDTGVQQYFCGVCADIDVSYKVTNQVEFDAKRYLLFGEMESRFREKWQMWDYSGADESRIFLLKLGDCADTSGVKSLLESIKGGGAEASSRRYRTGMRDLEA